MNRQRLVLLKTEREDSRIQQSDDVPFLFKLLFPVDGGRSDIEKVFLKGFVVTMCCTLRTDDGDLGFCWMLYWE